MLEDQSKSYQTNEPNIKYLTQDQVKKLFSKIQNKRDLTIFAVIYYFGLRPKEATLMRLDDVDFARNTIYIKRVKSGISGEKPLIGAFEGVRRLLKDYIENYRLPNGTALFTGRQGDLKDSRIRGLFYHYAKQADLHGFSVRSLRHSIAVHLLEAGQGIEYVQDHLSQKNIQKTMVYVKITDKKREEVARQLEHSPEIVRV